MKVTVKELLKLFDAISDAAIETRDKYQELLNEIDDLNKILDDEKPFETRDDKGETEATVRRVGTP